jgi:hypothetical protein
VFDPLIDGHLSFLQRLFQRHFQSAEWLRRSISRNITCDPNREQNGTAKAGALARFGLGDVSRSAGNVLQFQCKKLP